jgi:AraC-like DNA-binding protein
VTGVSESSVGLPVPALRPYVRAYHGYRYAGYPAGVHLGLPSPYLTVVVSLSGPIQVTFDRDGSATGLATLAGGLHTRPVYLPHDGDGYGVQLALTAQGARALLGLPAAALAGTVVGLDELLGPYARELPERMAALPGWGERYALLDEVLCRRLGEVEPPPAVLSYVWGRLFESGGAARIGELADEVGWSRRYLTGRFAAEYGLGPKDAARVVRFERSKAMLRRAASVAAAASACGYYDQAHLARDWRELAGVAPSNWLVADDLAARD